MEQEKNQNAGIAAKAGLWYTVCNFLFRGMAFLTTPIFSRLMTKAELGSFSNYSAWISILTVLTSFDLAQSIIRSKLEHEGDMDSYIWSMMAFSNLATLAAYGVVCLFSAFFVNLFQIEMKYIHLMFLYLLVSPAYTMLITKHRAFYRYRSFAVLTGVMALSSTLLSLALVLLMRDKLAGRIIGYYAPHIVISALIYGYLFRKGKRVKLGYWKYACAICLPLVPHVLSLYLLSSSDKVIITRICGAESTAIYSVAYSCYHIVTILFDSMNKAWAPWLLERLHHKSYDAIKAASKGYVAVFLIAVVGILLFVPELIFLLGGRQYADAVSCMPPLIASCVFQMIYTMYVNIEFYQKKTLGVAGATIIATAVNIIFNLIFIPMHAEHGYTIAAYTTLAGYMILFVLHYLMVKKMGLDFVYDTKYILTVLGAALMVSGAMNLLYRQTGVRYAAALVYTVGVAYLAYQKKDMIQALFRREK